MSGEYSTFMKIYGAYKRYLTETEKVRQLNDIDPGRVLTTNIAFGIPGDYRGAYYGKISIEFDDGTVIE